MSVARPTLGGLSPAYVSRPRYSGDKPAVLKEILSCLFLIAKADNVYHPKENEHLENAAQISGLSEAAFQ